MIDSTGSTQGIRFRMMPPPMASSSASSSPTPIAPLAGPAAPATAGVAIITARTMPSPPVLRSRKASTPFNAASGFLRSPRDSLTVSPSAPAATCCGTSISTAPVSLGKNSTSVSLRASPVATCSVTALPAIVAVAGKGLGPGAADSAAAKAGAQVGSGVAGPAETGRVSDRSASSGTQTSAQTSQLAWPVSVTFAPVGRLDGTAMVSGSSASRS